MPQDLSLDYVNADFIPGAAEIVTRWSSDAAAFREAWAENCVEIDYASHPRHKLDLFFPSAGQDAALGLLVFVHGGYWKAFDKSLWSHFARGALQRGWAVAIPGYTLAPDARLGQITGQIATAIECAAQRIMGPIVVTGHSAGGHLSARMACVDQVHAWSSRLRKVVPISPLSDLRPLMQTDMNEILGIDAPEADSESPALLEKRGDVECTVWVGGQERPSFLWQARTLSENWNCPWHVAAGLHHFNVIDDLSDPHSLLVETLLA